MKGTSLEALKFLLGTESTGTMNIRMKQKLLSPSFCLIFFIFLLSAGNSLAQNATTDPSEARALNSLFEQWDAEPVEGMWNISGELCSGRAIDDSEVESYDNNPLIKCDCSYDSATTCHITKLRVYALNKVGVIPEELAALKYLTYLKLDQNYFTGPLPSYIGNLTELTLLSIAQNAFNGTIPKELGNLKQLTLLSLGTNNFSGSLPRELGNLVELTELYIDSSGAGGEIPSTFANLTKMQTMWASNTPFTGKIPDFIGNWTDLRTLRFQGNSFEGPIPSSFSKLTSLTSLRITDLANLSSNLDFIKDMKSLSDLILRKALISDSIPSNIGEYNSLQILDLSFNNLTGQIPSALFNMSSLSYLFLGNNSLSGNLPSQKSNSLQNIDLSYNHFSGTFPSWVTPSLQLNLVANDFTFDSSNISVFPGLNCLQRDFPCNRDAPLYANFSVNCGGPQMTSDAGTVFEADNLTTLGVASLNVTNTEKWAVSNVGLFFDKKDPTYLGRTLTQVTGTNTPELFQSSRLSAGSLRYYGLGLENGSYTVTLQFAEIVFADRSTQTWQSLGRRVFDIYIQGHLREKDFDISKEAGGVNRAIQKPFSVNVTQHYVEIHLFWGGKGTCCTPNQGDYGPLISALSVVSDFEPTVSGIPPETSTSDNSKTGIIVGVLVAAVVVCLMLIFVIFYFRRKSYADEEELLGLSAKPNTFSYAELRSATNDFNPANKLGEGGFGPVYKGILSDGKVVAVKQLSVTSHQGKSQFVTEIATISAVQHRNLVKLYGCCIHGNKRLLVYEYLENKSLDQALFGAKDLHLDWDTRFSILLGTARGLAYLHEESRPRIVHRDVKASNILLDAELCPKISDFGLAKLYDDKKTHISTRVAGTIGYLAPEYAMRGHLTEKADVFGYGVVALEILSGRPNSDESLDGEQRYLLEWAWNLYENKRTLELVDPMVTSFDESEALRIIGVAFLCTQASPNLRPPMSRVVAMLTGDIEVTAVTSKPSYLTDWNFKDITSSFMDDDDSESKLTKAGDSEKGSSSTPFTTTDPIPSPVDPTAPILRDIIGEGR